MYICIYRALYEYLVYSKYIIETLGCVCGYYKINTTSTLLLLYTWYILRPLLEPASVVTPLDCTTVLSVYFYFLFTTKKKEKNNGRSTRQRHNTAGGGAQTVLEALCKIVTKKQAGPGSIFLFCREE